VAIGLKAFRRDAELFQRHIDDAAGLGGLSDIDVCSRVLVLRGAHEDFL
jgi:hypothetical protein